MKRTLKFIQVFTTVALTLLFTPIDAAERVLVRFHSDADLQVSKMDSAQGVIKKFRIDIDPEALYLTSKFGPARPSQKENRDTEPVELLLLSDDPSSKLNLSIKLVPDHFGQYIDGVDTFSGIVDGDESTSFVLSVENNQVAGQVRLNEYLIKLQYDQNLRSQVLSLVDLRLMPKDSMEAEYDTLNSYKNTLSIIGNMQTLSSSGAEGNIRVLFYYTAEAAGRNNINLMVANILSELNTSIDISDINPDIDFTSASIRQLSSNLDAFCIYANPALGITSIYSLMRDRGTPFDVVDGDMDQFSADIALAIVTTEPIAIEEPTYEYCSEIGRFGGTAADIYVADNPIAVTTDTYALADLTAVHELGHVIGGNHETESPHAVAIGTGTNARGYVSSTDSWQTIMGGYYGCLFDFSTDPSLQPCTRLNRWSNPSISYQGESTGDSDEADMESALEITAPIVSGWNTYPTPAPVTSPFISNDVNNTCTFVSWPFIFGSTHYQVFKSLSSSFSGGGDRVGISKFPGFVVTIPLNQTHYVRVRACNGSGCGPYSNILPVTFNLNCA